MSLDAGARTLVTASGEPYSYAECLVATGRRRPCRRCPASTVPACTCCAPSTTPGGCGPPSRRRGCARPAGRRRAPSSSARRSPASRSPRVLGHAGARDRPIVELEPFVLPRAAHPACAAGRRSVTCAPAATSSAGRRARARRAARRPPARVHPRGRRRRPGGASDLVVVCTGSRPNLAFSPASGLDRPPGLDVDERCRTAAPGLLAAGDVARTLDPVSGERVVVALWSSARRQGRRPGSPWPGVTCAVPRRRPVQHPARRRPAVRERRLVRGRRPGRRRRARETSVAVLGFRRRRLVGFNLLGDVRRAGPLLRALGRAPRDLAASGRVSSAVSLAAVREGMTWTTRSAG